MKMLLRLDCDILTLHMGTFACANSDEFKWGWWLRLVRTLTNFKKGLSALAWLWGVRTLTTWRWAQDVISVQSRPLAIRAACCCGPVWTLTTLKMGSRCNPEFKRPLACRPAAVGLCELWRRWRWAQDAIQSSRPLACRPAAFGLCELCRLWRWAQDAILFEGLCELWRDLGWASDASESTCELWRDIR